MKTQTQVGFTIIEVMLFLAVTGMLAVGILVGSSATLGQQRYRDSVNSLKSFIQEQYSQINNVVNSDSANPACIKRGNRIELDLDTDQARGTSECLVMGRLLQVEPTSVTAYSVIGRPNNNDTATSDTDALQNYLFTTSSPESKEVSWGARIVQPKTTNGLTASILIVRSPLSGSILTYTKDGTNAPSDMLNDVNMVQKNLCVDSQGSSGIGRRLAVRINAGASSQSAIEIPLEKDNVCD